MVGLDVSTLGREAGIVDLHVGHLGGRLGRGAGIVDLHVVGHLGGRLGCWAGGWGSGSSCWTLGKEAGIMDLHV